MTFFVPGLSLLLGSLPLCGADKLWLPTLCIAVVNSTLMSEFFYESPEWCKSATEWEFHHMNRSTPIRSLRMDFKNSSQHVGLCLGPMPSLINHQYVLNCDQMQQALLCRSIFSRHRKSMLLAWKKIHGHLINN